MKPNWAEFVQGGTKPKRAGDIDEYFFILYRVNKYKIFIVQKHGQTELEAHFYKESVMGMCASDVK